MNKLGFSVIRENYRSGEVVERSKTLWDIWGVTYIYGMFYRFGLIAYCLNVTIQSHAKLRSANACIQADKQFYKETDKNKKGRVFYGIFNRKDSNHHRWRKSGIE